MKERYSAFRREQTGLQEERLANVPGSGITHHSQRGLQLLPVMVFLDFLETQDLGNDKESNHSRVMEGPGVRLPPQEQALKPHGKLLWVSGWVTLKLPLVLTLP